MPQSCRLKMTGENRELWEEKSEEEKQRGGDVGENIKDMSFNLNGL